MCRVIVATLLAGLMVLAVAPAASANHLEDCIPYSHPKNPEDEIGVEAAIIGLNLITAELDVAAEAAETTPKNPVEIGLRVAAGVAAGVEWGTRLALVVLNGINAEADECRFDAHFHMHDDLMSSAIRRDLAVTTTPVAMFVLPEEHGGYIDAQDVGVKVVVREAIDRMKETSQCTCSMAESAYSHAVNAMESGQYKSAYRMFRQAYVYAFGN